MVDAKKVQQIKQQVQNAQRLVAEAQQLLSTVSTKKEGWDG